MSTSPHTPQLTISRAGDADWDDARQAWNLAADQHPAGVVYVESVDDVVAAVNHAREAGLRVAVQGTGHGAPAHGSLERALLIRTDRLTGVTVDPENRTARAEAGVLAGDVSAAAAEHGLAALGGSSPDVGVVGYTLGGGLGWLGRLYGLAADAVIAVEVVTADGDIKRVDADNEPDLFWALRGGGGAFAVVTAIEFALFELPEVFGGAVVWPGDKAVGALERYKEWADSLPDEWTTSIRLRNMPDVPFVPEPLRGRVTVSVDGAFAGSADEGSKQLQPLIDDLGEPLLNEFGPLTAGDLIRMHGDPEQPVAAYSEHAMLTDLAPDTIKAIVDVAGPESGTQLLGVEIRQLGGALSFPASDRGAARLNGAYTLYALGSPMLAPEAAIKEHLAKTVEAVKPWSTGGAYLNFDDAEPRDTARSFDAETYARLQDVKGRYDGDDLIQSNHPIPPAAR